MPRGFSYIGSIFFVFLSSCASLSVSQGNIVKTSLQGYKEFKLGNYNKAHKLFEKALKLSSKRKWPSYNFDQMNKILKESRAKHEYDWNGTNEQKIIGLLEVYNLIKNYFSGFGITTNVNWDELVIKYLPQVIEAKDMEEYYKLLQKLVANLNDNHTLIIIPDSLQDNLDRPPVFIEFIENEFVITDVKDVEEIKEQNIYPGLIIKKVEGVPVKEYFMKNKLPYMPLSKVEKERFYRVYNLLSGKKNTKVRITVQDTDGTEREVVLTRDSEKYAEKEKKPPLVEVKELKPGIIYFNFRRFWPADTIIQEFKKAFNKLDLSKTKGIIIDVRDNPGGNSKVGDEIISHLISKPFISEVFKFNLKYLIDSKLLDRWTGHFKALKFKLMNSLFGKKFYITYNEIKPDSDKHYSGPVVVLVSRYTGSAAEDFACSIKESKRAKIVGETTSGGTGNGAYCILPGYGRLRVCINVCGYPNGKIWQGAGIEPDIEVSKKIEDIYTGHDPVLEKGLEELNR